MLVVGLGNPGERYCGTPHNVGFRVLDAFAEQRGQVGWSQRFEARVAVTQIDREELILLEPLTFMNRSGQSVKKALSFFNIAEDSTLVVHDELDLPFGNVKLKRGGGEAGHNGLKSVSAELGTREYCRLRVGVGRPATGDVAEFLLMPFSPEDGERLGPSIAAASDAISLVARHGVDRAMAVVNGAPINRPLPPAAAPAAGRPD
jgi:PTH1 family peptidyl-tRNA hydrolase